MADTLTAPKSGRATLRRSAQTSPRSIRPVPEYARAYMLRLARRLADRASVKRTRRTEDSAQRVARLAPAAGFLARFLADPQPSPWHSAWPWCDGSLDQAWQALNAGDPARAVKMLNEATEQLREPLVQATQTERQRIAQAIRTTRLMMANPQHCPRVGPVGAPALSLLCPAELAALLNTTAPALDTLPPLDLDALLSDFQPEHLSGFEPEPQTSASTGAEVWGVAA
jgi:hypothetical protein